ncbi:fibroblast growth factor 19 isoform X1 [Takifugu rubripes]|uniref:fibroblast growth factor 19 isoform X1 n=1 Tax=Takifugu rubripes TaxID=31033 RepID=UPI0000660884|nr:fibroblast growth factor 19-like isoform X1 [Takifugu rubripes]
MVLLMLPITVANLFLCAGVLSLPLLDQGSHFPQGWEQVVRFRHLYAASAGLHLLITEEGSIQGSADPTLYSLMEIRPVDPGCVVIRGAATTRFLCIEGAGRLYSSQTYSKDDCTFREQILADGYSVYRSVGHGALVSLGNYRQQLRGEDWSVPTLAQFLPRISSLDQDFKAALDETEKPEQTAPQRSEPVDMVDSFGKLSQIIHSPSFHKR